MEYTTLGRTGLRVSVAGLGCGGASRLGLGRGGTEADAVDIVRAALDLGITYLDSSPGYGTEGLVGRGISGRRDDVVLATKVDIRPSGGAPLITAPLIRDSIESSLRRFGTDVIDVLQVHGPALGDYRFVVDEAVPELLRLRERGLIRYIGVTESFRDDPSHQLLGELAADDDCWDVALVGFSLLNPTARSRVLPWAERTGAGVVAMYAVRSALSRPELLHRSVRDALDRGLLDPRRVDVNDPLGFLLHPEGAESLIDAAYRFARHDSLGQVVLTGTGNADHLMRNVASILGPPLPPADLARLHLMFGAADFWTGN